MSKSHSHISSPNNPESVTSQKEHSRTNQIAWSHKAYESAVQLGGTPEEAAQALQKDPEFTLRAYRKYLGDVKGKKIANLLGSIGKKAIALSLLGAEVTVVDITKENQRYALECADAAGVSLNYIVSDLLEWPTKSYKKHFDLVLMELGILHYFIDLNPLVKLICDILLPNGQFVLHEFHPIMRKCAPNKDENKLILNGDYFSDKIIEKPAPRATVAYSQEELTTFPTGRYKYWQLGEVISAIGANGLTIKTLEEYPHGDFPTLPGVFTLVAQK